MNASAPIAPGSPQRLPTRAAPSLVRALRDALGVPSMDAVDDPLPLDRHQPFYATCLRSTAQIAATLTPAPGPLDGVITITGIGDHFRLEWPITITGMRS